MLNNLSNEAAHRWRITSRIIASIIPAFLLTNSLGIFLSLSLPFDKLNTVTWSMVLGFLFYSTVIIWIFHEPSLKRIWLTLIAGIAISSGGSYILLQSGSP